MATESEMIERAKQKVLTSTTWFSPAELAKFVDVPSADMEIQLSAWKKSGMLFSVLHEGVVLFPSYVFDGNKRKPIEGLHPILALFANKKNDWGLAYWFAGANGYLGGKRPQDMLPVDPGRVLLAALDELAGVTHG